MTPGREVLMNENFWNGFEKRAGWKHVAGAGAVAGTLGGAYLLADKIQKDRKEEKRKEIMESQRDYENNTSEDDKLRAKWEFYPGKAEDIIAKRRPPYDLVLHRNSPKPWEGAQRRANQSARDGESYKERRLRERQDDRWMWWQSPPEHTEKMTDTEFRRWTRTPEGLGPARKTHWRVTTGATAAIGEERGMSLSISRAGESGLVCVKNRKNSDW